MIKIHVTCVTKTDPQNSSTTNNLFIYNSTYWQDAVSQPHQLIAPTALQSFYEVLLERLGKREQRIQRAENAIFNKTLIIIIVRLVPVKIKFLLVWCTRLIH